ncbi:uncharacterized protein PITG_05808 [Phytophthora infestans T30-4]|uniref:Uncharacterized protein n=1 Tax=Phytophthora infestans (strain T30-4) TaxID=403677 RepID=D0N5Q8_PHYIT|nr:uncharacterized protein PITG_05808 [Phytophthora infestans T30-4]EEY70399.1 hypothetical protein PITG_05808 [Phytophthora infestans T30-4]|eukprot:XP_002998053.1 hypothetical protein PITG_05808 [Phytophthora infestans T30-4]
MADTKCERLFRDHSQKFCSKLKIYGSDGSKKHESDGPRICVCDNANANRNLIERVSRNFRTPEECASRVRSVLEANDPACITAQRSSWEECVSSNLAQIRRGDI